VTDEPDLDRLFTRLSTERRRPAPDDHPASEKLSAYLANELSPEEDDAIQEHLTACTLCTGLLLDLQRFLDPPEEDRPREGVADFESAAEWRELKGRMGGRVEGGGGGRLPRSSPFRRIFGSVRVWQGVAAVLAVGVVGMGVYVLKLRGDMKAPRSGYHILLSGEKTRSSTESVGELRLHETPSDFSLTLVKPPELNFPEYVVEISREPEGSQVRTVRGLRYQEDEGVTLLLSKDDFKPGMYEIELRGPSDGQPEIAVKYRLSVLP
jgi:putative zinc finger protein